jgi:transposase InsO family protein
MMVSRSNINPKERTMTQQQYVIRRKLNVVELATTLGSISEAYRKLNVNRQHDYDVKKALAEESVQGLLEKARTKARTANRLSPDIEAKILDYSLQYPAQGQVRVANELAKQGVTVSAGGIRSVWLRHRLERKEQRLKRLEQWAAQNGGVLTESQVQALETVKEEKEAHGEIETFHPGFLFGQDTFYVGWIKGIGRIYQQTGIDTWSNLGFAKLYTEKTAVTAADFLNDKVLPFFDEQGVRVLRTLTDRGTEYCGIQEHHPYELFCYLNDIEHSKTKARHPQTNGCTERLNQIILDEFYQVAFRKKVYATREEIQKDLDSFMDDYNHKRTNQGRHCQGRTPWKTFKAGLKEYGGWCPSRRRRRPERRVHPGGQSVNAILDYRSLHIDLAKKRQALQDHRLSVIN